MKAIKIAWWYVGSSKTFNVAFLDLRKEDKQQWLLTVKNPFVEHKWGIRSGKRYRKVYICDDKEHGWICKTAGECTWDTKDIKTARKTWKELIRNGMKRV